MAKVFGLTKGGQSLFGLTNGGQSLFSWTNGTQSLFGLNNMYSPCSFLLLQVVCLKKKIERQENEV